MIRLTFIALALLALAACARPAGVSDAAARAVWEAQQHLLRGVERWDLHARAALRLEAEAYQIGVRWRRGPAHFTLLLEAPFGQGVIRIDALPLDGYELSLPDGQRFTGESPEVLLEEVTGWSLPVGGLEYWIRGLPRPDSEYRHRSYRDGRARWIRQDDWSIDYLDYFDDAAAASAGLPRRIDIERDSISLKLVIERWQAAELEAPPADLFPDFD